VGDLILGLKNTYKLWDEVGCRVAVGKSAGEGKMGKKGVEEQNDAVLWVLFFNFNKGILVTSHHKMMSFWIFHPFL
jgi:hypothetical protein